MSDAGVSGPIRGFIDSCAVFGPGGGQTAEVSLESLVDQRRRHGIAFSLARYTAGVTADAELGNRVALAAAADGAAGVKAVAVVWPTSPGKARRIAGLAADAGAVAFWAQAPFAAMDRSLATREALLAVAEIGLPIFIPTRTVGQPTSLTCSEIGETTADLGVPIVLAGVGYWNAEEAKVASSRYGHLWVETSHLAHWRAIEDLAAAIGWERILLGVGGPRRAAQAPINAILASDLPDLAKAAILGGNASRLFALPDTGVTVAEPWLPERTWDVHTHSGPLPLDMPAVADLGRALDPYRTVTATHSSGVAIFGDLDLGNQAAIDGSDAAHRVYLVVNPGEPALSRGQLRRYGRDHAVVGVKIHGPWSGTETDSPAMRALFDDLADLGKPVLIHNHGPGWEHGLIRIADAHPSLPIIIAHGGLGSPCLAAASVVARTSNVYVELASSVADVSIVRELVATIEPGRMLYGSDAPLMDPAFVMGTYHDAGLTSPSADRVYWSNAASLFSGDRR